MQLNLFFLFSIKRFAQGSGSCIVSTLIKVRCYTLREHMNLQLGAIKDVLRKYKT